MNVKTNLLPSNKAIKELQHKAEVQEERATAVALANKLYKDIHNGLSYVGIRALKAVKTIKDKDNQILFFKTLFRGQHISTFTYSPIDGESLTAEEILHNDLVDAQQNIAEYIWPDIQPYQYQELFYDITGVYDAVDII